MAYENIRSDVPAFCVAGDYFYIMKGQPTNSLIQKTSNGDPVMTYPLSHEMDPAGGSFVSLQYDGINFWSLEKRTVDASTEKERILRRWRVEDFVCVLKDSWRLHGLGSANENMSGTAFAVESYINKLSRAAGPHTIGLYPQNEIKLQYPHAAFFRVTDQLVLRSTTDPSICEDLPVYTTPDSTTVQTSSNIQNDYYVGDSVILRRDMYYFNNESPSVGAAGAAVYHFSVPHMSAADPTVLNELTYKSCHESGVYEQTKCATFITTSGLDSINSGHYTGLIGYVRNQNLLLKKPNMPAGGLLYPGNIAGTNIEFRSNEKSMIIDNAIKNDRINLHTIYSIAPSIDDDGCIATNLFRLQQDYTYGALEGTFSEGPYNYVVSVLRPMVTSIALTAEPALVVANGVDTALIWATVLDQYGAPMNFKRIVFSLSASSAGSKGYFTCPTEISECTGGAGFRWLDAIAQHQSAEIFTGAQSAYNGGPPAMQGQAVIEWRAGTEAGMVSIMATVQP
jgi:hypothetical protein